MRKILMLVVMVVMAVVAMAQTPNKISYQAVVRDGQNRLVTNSDVTVFVKIGGYEETFSVTTNANGLVSLQIPTDAHQAAFDGINWASTNTITTTVTIVSTSEAMTSTVPVTAVPYALYANNVNPSVIDTLVSINELTVILENYVTNAHLNDTLSNYTTTDKIDTLLSDYATNAHLNDTLSHYTTTDKIDTLLGDYVTNAHLNDTLSHYTTTDQMDSLIGSGKYYIVNPVTGEVIDSILVNFADIKNVKLPSNLMTLKFYTADDSLKYNAFEDYDPFHRSEFVVDLRDVITTQAIVRYINRAQATSSVNDVDSIYNALTDPANADVKEELIRKAKQVAINHERDAMDIALEYFKHFDGDDVRYILDRVDSANIAQFINSVNTLTPADANKIMGALAANVKAAQVGQLVKALSDRISAAQAREFINAVIENIDASQVDVLIDTLNDAANADANSAAGRLKARIDAHINALIEARIQQYISTGH